MWAEKSKDAYIEAIAELSLYDKLLEIFLSLHGEDKHKYLPKVVALDCKLVLDLCALIPSLDKFKLNKIETQDGEKKSLEELTLSKVAYKEKMISDKDFFYIPLPSLKKLNLEIIKWLIENTDPYKIAGFLKIAMDNETSIRNIFIRIFCLYDWKHCIYKFSKIFLEIKNSAFTYDDTRSDDPE